MKMGGIGWAARRQLINEEALQGANQTRVQVTTGQWRCSSSNGGSKDQERLSLDKSIRIIFN